MSELDTKIESLTASVKSLAVELADKKSLPADRLTAIEGELTTQANLLEELHAQKAQADLLSRVSDLESSVSKAFATSSPAAKAAAILTGAHETKAFIGGYDLARTGGLTKAILDSSQGGAEAQAFLSTLERGASGRGVRLGHDEDVIKAMKGVLGTSDATGQSIVPNNFVAGLETLSAQANIYRRLMTVVPGVRGAGVDIPYEDTAIGNALLQGAYGSNKDIRDFSFGQATATLYTIAQIADIGNQLLRQSEGAAETVARRRLGLSIGQLEAAYVVNGSGSSQPLGILQALLAYGDIAKYKYALNSESRASALGNGLAKIESNLETADAIVMNPTDFWEMTTETLGSSGSGGWAMDPVGGATNPRVTVWGVPVYRDTTLTAGTALVGNFGACEIYLGQGYTIDVSSEGGNRFDQNVTGFRAEEEFAFNAEPYVRTNKFVKVTGV